jgi:mannose-6-phosphate isomerase-like protein (cupin superfamily)
MKIQILKPSCNIDTVSDGRGGIFTWLPEDPLVEFNMLYFQPGKTRGNHYHPEFIEYFLVVEGQGVMVTKDSDEAPEEVIHMSKGMCTRSPKGVAHAFYAITPVTAIAMLSKRWDDCHPPIVHVPLINSTGTDTKK